MSTILITPEEARLLAEYKNKGKAKVSYTFPEWCQQQNAGEGPGKVQETGVYNPVAGPSQDNDPEAARAAELQARIRALELELSLAKSPLSEKWWRIYNRVLRLVLAAVLGAITFLTLKPIATTAPYWQLMLAGAAVFMASTLREWLEEELS